MSKKDPQVHIYPDPDGAKLFSTETSPVSSSGTAKPKKRGTGNLKSLFLEER